MDQKEYSVGIPCDVPVEERVFGQALLVTKMKRIGRKRVNQRLPRNVLLGPTSITRSTTPARGTTQGISPVPVSFTPHLFWLKWPVFESSPEPACAKWARKDCLKEPGRAGICQQFGRLPISILWRCPCLNADPTPPQEISHCGRVAAI